MPRHEYRDRSDIPGPAFGAAPTPGPDPAFGGVRAEGGQAAFTADPAWYPAAGAMVHPWADSGSTTGTPPSDAAAGQGAGSADPGGRGRTSAGGDPSLIGAATANRSQVPRGRGPAQRRDGGAGGNGRGAGGPVINPPLARPLLVSLVVLSLLVPYALTLALFWVRSGAVLTATTSERQGVAYLRPLAQLLSAAIDQQSAVIAGNPGEGRQVRAAMHEVDVVDASLGNDLGTTDRWSNARRRLTALLDSPPAPTTAYQDFGQVVDLLVALTRSIADRSTLILDPDLDTYYLMDATVLRLPTMLVSAGRLSDLGRTAAGARSSGAIALVAGIHTQSEGIGDDLRTSFAANRTGTLTPGLVSALDQFSDAVNTLVPGLNAQGSGIPSGARLKASRDRVRDSGLDLQAAAFNQLDDRLAARQNSLGGQRSLVIVASLIGALMAGLGRWLLLRPQWGHDGQGAAPDAAPGEPDRRSPPPQGYGWQDQAPASAPVGRGVPAGLPPTSPPPARVAPGGFAGPVGTVGVDDGRRGAP